MTKKKNSKSALIGFATILTALVVGILLGTVSFLLFNNNPPVEPNSVSTDEQKIANLAQKIFANCKTETDHWKCYERDIPKLMDDISMVDAFKVVYEVQNLDRNYQYCHTLGHALSAREVQKDPSKWKEVVNMCPSGVCSNGCIHGGFQEKFRDLDVLSNLEKSDQEKIIEDLKIVCEAKPSWRPTGTEQASCYHALGHLTMYITFADAKEASDICDVIAKKDDGRDFTSVCYDGVFMQIFQPLEAEDFAMIKGKEVTKVSLNAFCNRFSGLKKSSCFSEAWPLYRSELQDPKNVQEFCGLQDAESEDRCWIAIAWVVTAQSGFNGESMNTYCEGYPEARQARCFADVAARMLENDFRNVEKAPVFCSAIVNDENKKSCFDELVKAAVYNFPKGSDDAMRLCSLLPNPWQEECSKGL